MAKEDLDKEDLPFEVPEFNEDDFVRRELISFRTTLILFVYALIVALATFFIWRATDVGFFVLFLIAMALGGLVPFIYKLFRVDISHFRRKEWIGTMSLHFFFWLGFTLLLSNPPISDSAPPVIEVFGAPSVQGPGEEIRLAAYIGDNERVTGEPTFCVRKVNTTDCAQVDWSRVEGQPVWTASFNTTTTGEYEVLVMGADASGQSTEGRATINVTEPFQTINPNNDARFERLSDQLFVRPASGFRELRAVQYVIDDQTFNMAPPTATQPYWTAGPTFPGWKTGKVNVTLQAIEQPEYLHNYKLEGGTARSAAAVRTYDIATDFPDVGTVAQPNAPEKPAPNLAQTPGPEAATLLAAIALLAVGLRARRKE